MTYELDTSLITLAAGSVILCACADGTPQTSPIRQALNPVNSDGKGAGASPAGFGNQSGNTPPVLDAIDPISVNAGSSFTVRLRAKDPTNAQIGYAISCIGKQETNSHGTFTIQVPANSRTQTVDCGAQAMRAGGAAGSAKSQQGFQVIVRGNSSTPQSNQILFQQQQQQQQNQAMIFESLGGLFNSIVNKATAPRPTPTPYRFSTGTFSTGDFSSNPFATTSESGTSESPSPWDTKIDGVNYDTYKWDGPNPWIPR